MTFLEYLKKKEIDMESLEMSELIEEYYDEYSEYLSNLKEGCTPKVNR